MASKMSERLNFKSVEELLGVVNEEAGICVMSNLRHCLSAASLALIAHAFSRFMTAQNILVPETAPKTNYFSARPFSKIRKKLLSKQTRRGASQTLFIFKKRALVHLCSVLNCIFQSLNCNCQCSFLYSSTSKITHIQCQSIIIICSHTKGK